MLEFQVFCIGHFKHKDEKRCSGCQITQQNIGCDLGYEPVSCLGHITKDRCTTCFGCSPKKMPEYCRYPHPLHDHPIIKDKRTLAQIPVTIAAAQQAVAPDTSYYLG